jgi:hypothetical protein
MVRKEFADSEKNIDEFCKKFSVTEEEFKSAMSHSVPAERERQLKHFIKTHVSRYDRFALNWKREAGNMSGMQDDFVKLVERRNSLLGDAGNFIVKLIKTDPQWQESMNRALNDEMPNFKNGPETLQTYEGARTLKDSMTADGIVTKAEKFRAAKLSEWGSGRTWKDPAEATYAEGEFMKEMEKEIGSGFWASLIRALFNANKSDPRIKKIFTK